MKKTILIRSDKKHILDQTASLAIEKINYQLQRNDISLIVKLTKEKKGCNAVLHPINGNGFLYNVKMWFFIPHKRTLANFNGKQINISLPRVREESLQSSKDMEWFIIVLLMHEIFHLIGLKDNQKEPYSLMNGHVSENTLILLLDEEVEYLRQKYNT